MQKKVLVILLACMICLFAFSACSDKDPALVDSNQQTTEKPNDNNTTDEPNDNNNATGESTLCQHTFGEWNVIKQASCKAEGKCTRTCTNCFYVEEKSIPKTEAHTVVTDVEVPASCKQTGLSEGSHCSECQKILVKQVEIPKKSHNYIDRKCDFCGEKKASSGLAFRDYEGYAIVTGIGSCTDTVIIIPNEAPSGLPVLEIDTQAFQNCTNIVEVVIPDKVVCIGIEAFMNCTSLQKITLPSEYQDMWLGTFRNCTALKEITIPNNVFRIGPSCFANCTSLENVTISSSVTTYSKDAFVGCSIKNLYISSLDVWCKSKFYNLQANPLFCAENFYIQQELITTLEINTDIPFGVFAGYEKLSKVVFGNLVQSIGESAFYGCSGLSRVAFGNKVQTIDKCAFYNCIKLNNVHLPSSMKTISQKAFYGCTALQTITVASGLQYLGDYAFGGCISLKEIDLPSTITYMGISSFEKCASLERITIPFVGVATCLGRNQAFGSLFGEEEYEGGEMITQLQYWIGYQEFVYSYCIPKTLKHVKVLKRDESSSSREFVNCKYIESITYGKNVTRVDSNSINGCTALSDIYYEGTKEEWKKLLYSEYISAIETLTITCSDGVLEKK